MKHIIFLNLSFSFLEYLNHVKVCQLSHDVIEKIDSTIATCKWDTQANKTATSGNQADC